MKTKSKERYRSNQKEAEAAYKFWLTRPHDFQTHICEQFKIQVCDLTLYMKDNKLKRPDGRVLGKGSDRQLAIAEACKEAHAKGKDMVWAMAYARARATSIQKGDLRYYCLKNDLPDLAEPPPFRMAVTKHG